MRRNTVRSQLRCQDPENCVTSSSPARLGRRRHHIHRRLLIRLPGLESGFTQRFNYFVGIIRITQLLRMDEIIPTTAFPFHHIAIGVQLRDLLMDKCDAVEQSKTLANFRSLLPDGFGEPVKTLRRTHDHTPVLPVLGDHFQHLRGEVFGLVTGKPVLHLVNTGNHTLNPVLVGDELTPMLQGLVLTLQGKVSKCFGIRVFRFPSQGLLRHGDGFAIALTAGENDAALVTKKLRVLGVVIRYQPLGKVVKQVLPERDLHRLIMFALQLSLSTSVSLIEKKKITTKEKNPNKSKKEQR